MGSRHSRPKAAVTEIALTMALLATACGGGGDGASTRADAPAAPATGGGSDKPADAGGDFCAQVKEALSQVGTYMEAAISSDPEVRRRTLTKQKDLNAKLLKAAPKEIRRDLETQTRDQDAMIDAQIRGDDAAAAALIAKPEFQAATARVGTYYKDKCGLTFTGSGG